MIKQEIDIAGALDFHVHAAPSLFSRWGDAFELAALCSQAQMAGFVLKFHHGSSVEIALQAQKKHPELKVVGGVVLNAFAGGLNPFAVDAALALGGKVVWMPTIHANAHAEACGCLGGFDFQKSDTKLDLKAGIRVLDAKSKLKQEVKEIIALVEDKKAVLASGHLSFEEILAIRRYLTENNYQCPFLINHAFFSVPKLSLDQLREIQAPTTWVECSQLSVSKITNAASVEEVVKAIQDLPNLNWILVSDSGQKENIASPQALAGFGKELIAQGLSEEAFNRFVKTNPQRLIEATH